MVNALMEPAFVRKVTLELTAVQIPVPTSAMAMALVSMDFVIAKTHGPVTIAP